MSILGTVATDAIGVVDPEAGLALKAVRKVGGFFKSLPWHAWVVIATVALLVGGYFLHRHKADAALKAAYAAGAADEDVKWQKQLAGTHAAAVARTANTEATGVTISQQTGAQHDQDLHDIGSRADDQRLHGPGKAAAPAGSGSGEHPPLPAAAQGDRPQQSAVVADARLDGLPAAAGLAIVPWADLVDHAQQCDAERSENLTWHSWYIDQAAAWEHARQAAVAAAAAPK